MDTSVNIPFNSAFSQNLWIWGMLLLVVVVVFLLLGILEVQRRQLFKCRYVIVRLMNEKEELKKLLPPDAAARYLPYKLTRTELLSVVKMINRLLIRMPNEVVGYPDQSISPRNGPGCDPDRPVPPPNDNG